MKYQHHAVGSLSLAPKEIPLFRSVRCQLQVLFLLLSLTAGHICASFPVPAPDPKEVRPVVTLAGHDYTIYSIAFSPDGRLLASASNGADLAERAAEFKLWDLKTQREIHTLRGHRYGVWKLAFSPDGKRLASAGKDDVVKVWDVATGKESLTLKGHTEDVYGVAWAPDGKSIASCSEVDERGPLGEVRLWDAATGRSMRTVTGPRGRWRTFALAYSPDGKRLATANEHGVAILDPATGKETASLGDKLNFELAAVAFSPDGKRLAARRLTDSLTYANLCSRLPRGKSY